MRKDLETLISRKTKRTSDLAGLQVMSDNSLIHNYGLLRLVTCVALVVLACVISAQAQVTTGNVRGTVLDPNGAVVAIAKVTITDPKTNQSFTTQSTSSGEYEFRNLPVSVYTITVEAPGFNVLTLTDVRVNLNQTTDVPTALAIGAQSASITVSAGGAELVETTTTTLSKQFNERQVVDFALTGSTAANGTGAGAGINNLSLLSPNVTSNGGVGVGIGGSVGGQRPRNNNFVVDGIDNNAKSVTGPEIYVTPEAVSEFSLLTNQYSAEFARSTGGQFITVTKSGTNEFHGTGYEFFRNRKLNALDTLDKLGGVVREDNVPGHDRQRRYDYNRFGFNLGGPLYIPRLGEGGRNTYPWSGPNKLFFFTSFEDLRYGYDNSAAALQAPTAAGLATIAGIPGISQRNFGVFKQFVPVAPRNDAGTITINNGAGSGDVAIPIGNISVPSPFFETQRNFVLNLDFTQSSKTQHRTRFIYNRDHLIDNSATFPQFFTQLPQDGRLFSYTMIHQFTPTLSNELRLSYRRYVQIFVVPNIQFPGLDQFPNITLEDLGGKSFNIGPGPNAPQFTIENNYQIINNVSYLRGNHSIKFGGDFRWLISPQGFVQRQRGDYDYGTTAAFLLDVSPDQLAERNVGAGTYYGNQKLLFLFAQDDWRARPNLTFNLGLNYAYQQAPLGARQQSLNAAASAPGLINFGAPRTQKKNFAPRFGIAYAPNYSSGLLGRLFGSSGQSSIRASFQMAYDVIFDNLYILSVPPQFQQTIDVDPGIPGFLAGGGISPNPVPTGTASLADLRAATSHWIPDQQVPYSISWSLSYQRQFFKNYAIEFRYLGSRGIHLLTQNRINRQPRVTDTNFIPTFFSMPTADQLAGLKTFRQFRAARPNFVPSFAAAGFNAQNLVAFLSNGNSTYHGGSVQLTRRFTNGLQFSAAYTLSHLIDDTTAEVNATALSPRRVQDFYNLRAERSDSALDRRHRFVFSGIYDLPFFRNSSNHFVRTVFGGFSLAGVLAFESGEKMTILSGIDANQNGDAAGDRTIINPNGAANSASSIIAVDRTGTPVFIFNPVTGGVNPNIVAYVAANPNARYIQAGPGARANAGRNTFALPGINNLDFSLFKNFRLSENKKIQLRADLYNIFNHPQYTPGSVNSVDLFNTSSASQVNTIGVPNPGSTLPGSNPAIFQAGQVFTNHPRVIQLGLRLNF